MLLTIDIGNTNVTLGVYDGDALLFVARLATNRSRTCDQYAIELADVFRLYGADHKKVTGAVLSCVVPELTAGMVQAVEQLCSCKLLVLGPGVKTGLNILTDSPVQVGADLVAGAVAAAALYPLPCFVIDLGTATKISVLNAQGAFCGCAIAPGVGISMQALSAQASQLPSIPLDAPRHAIGKNTVDSMQSGLVFGTAAMLDGLCDRIQTELGEPVQTIVATGGLSPDIIKSCRHKVIHNGELILYGLKLIHQKNTANGK